MVTVSESTISSGRARFILMINSSAYTVSNNTIQLLGGDGGPCVHGINESSPRSLQLTCPGLRDGVSYSLMVDLSDADTCLMILIRFDTPLGTVMPSSSSMTAPITSGGKFHACTPRFYWQDIVGRT